MTVTMASFRRGPLRLALVLCCTIEIVLSQLEDDPRIVLPDVDHSVNFRAMDDVAGERDRGSSFLTNSSPEEVAQEGLSAFDGLYGAGSESILQLLKPGEAHDRMELNMLTVEKLAAITDPVSIVSAVGPYHGGKSFLLNVLLNSTHGFDVGAVPEPETRGMWMRLLSKNKVSGADGSVVVLLDTEGFYGEGATRSYDARVFALATLLSSHLIYNTIRTLGDSQSVSALADLAKQAQVFNLQNWLHSGDASSSTFVVDIRRRNGSQNGREAHSASSISILVQSLSRHTKAEAFSPSAMNPLLLLRTLKFPSLTWVVQGFDIGLQSVHTPMDYLQRYLAAHAHTGDRTLDTLFTEGIKCHTMRTPTDLNLLRQVFGDAGLASPEELFPYLHPGYLKDIEALQKTVFGNLTAKGKLSGKDIAGMLPVLVHYVNEDFPLNAERKLRDVLVDVIVDGAFSGGVQYFQLCMKTFPDRDKVLSVRGSREVNVAGAELHSADDGTRLSALAAEAYTDVELEQLLNAAAQRAIEYCRQRSIGVPLERSSVTCEGQLGVKIDRMKPRYREENDQKVKEVLVILGEGFRATAKKDIDGLLLPMPESQIHQICKSTIMDAIKRYEELVGPHRGSHLYEEARVQIQMNIQMTCDNAVRINADMISEILGKGKIAYRDGYENAIKREECGQSSTTEGPNQIIAASYQTPCSTKRVHEICKIAEAEAQAEFDKSVQKEGLPWLGPGVEQYDFQTYQCTQWSRQRFADFSAQNEGKLMSYCAQQAATLILKYKEEAAKIVPFPDNDEVLIEKTDDLEKLVVEEYAALVKNFLPSSAAEDKRRELLRSIGDLKSHILRKNTALMRAFCYDPLHDAYKELRMQDCERTYRSMWITKAFWSRKCLWPGPKYTFGFKYAAYVAARKYLEAAQSASKASAADSGGKVIVLSVATRNKVIESWIEQDLAAHAHLVFVNFILVALLSTVAFASVFSLYWKLASLRARKRGGGSTPAFAFGQARNPEHLGHDSGLKREGGRDGHLGAYSRAHRRVTFSR